MVRVKGFEPPRLSAAGPKPAVSTVPPHPQRPKLNHKDHQGSRPRRAGVAPSGVSGRGWSGEGASRRNNRESRLHLWPRNPGVIRAGWGAIGRSPGPALAIKQKIPMGSCSVIHAPDEFLNDSLKVNKRDLASGAVEEIRPAVSCQIIPPSWRHDAEAGRANFTDEAGSWLARP